MDGNFNMFVKLMSTDNEWMRWMTFSKQRSDDLDMHYINGELSDELVV